MEKKKLSLPAVRRNTQITEQERDVLFSKAEDPNATEGVLDWTPQRVAQRKRTVVAR